MKKAQEATHAAPDFSPQVVAAVKQAVGQPPEWDLAEEVAACYADPLRFVATMYPWRQKGSFLEAHDGPDVWQAEFLRKVGKEVVRRGFDGVHPVAPLRAAVSKGHGVGGSVMCAWLVDWIMATRPDCRGTVTANTFTQLQTKTWATIQRWTKVCLCGHWFVINADRMYHPEHRESWQVSAQSCKEENSEAFAGQHAADSTSFYIMDEDSAVPDTIHEVAEGGLTDGEAMMYLFGNPTRTTGAFHRACFGLGRDRWITTIVDSRTSRFTNQAQIAEWLDEYGEESDFFRVRVRGLPPSASDLQFIDSERVAAAQSRLVSPLIDEPLVCGLDVARGGSDDCVFRFRRGMDASSIAPIRLPGVLARDSMRLVSLAADVLTRKFEGRKVAVMFIDGTGVGGPIVNRLHQLGHQNVVEIQFGAAPPDPKMANMRSYMWNRMKEWLLRGRIDKNPRLEIDLCAPGYSINKRDAVVLESKESIKSRGLDSPDDGDALALTFAQNLAPLIVQTSVYRPSTVWS